MFQVRIHGRGGQGVVSAAEMLSIAAFDEGLHAQAFPSFGSERMGAPVTAFCRFDEREIRSREPVVAPDALIIQDPTLLHQLDVLAGLAPSGFILLNSRRDFTAMGLADYVRAFPARNRCIVPASDIAMKHVGRPLPNAALLGAFAAMTGRLSLESVCRAIEGKFPGKVGAANAAAAREAYDVVARAHAQEVAHA